MVQPLPESLQMQFMNKEGVSKSMFRCFHSSSKKSNVTNEDISQIYLAYTRITI